VGENGQAWGIDHIPQLVDFAIANTKKGNPDVLNKRCHFSGM
jgi:hypothetical protein